MVEGLRTVALATGERVPALGQGTWHMGEDRRQLAAEADALRLGIDLGLTLIDTAEMYGNGGAEEVVAEAIAGRGERLFVVSKVLPHNASKQGVVTACEQSLKRLKRECIDLYLLHWRGTIAFAETLAGFELLRRDGKIRHHGVSNFSAEDMREWTALAGGERMAANQILYNLSRRGPEWDVLPRCRERGVAVMAYSPIEQGRLLKHKELVQIAQSRNATPAQVALAWLLRQDGMIVIPKATRPQHVRENRQALDLALSDEELARLDRAFPPPKGKTALGML